MSDTESQQQSFESIDVIEYCLANVSTSERQQIESAETSTHGVRCLDRCGTCYKESFIVVNGKPVTGAACDQLIESLDGGETS